MRPNLVTRMPSWLAAALTAALLSSCAPRTIRKTASSTDAAAAAANSDAANKAGKRADGTYAPGVDVTEASLRGADFQSVDGLEVIHFDYDSASLKEEALEALKKNAEYLKARAGQDFLIAGHCDQRGTIEYNLALGQKRAKEVRDYYVRLGVDGKKIATISYGKENLLCAEDGESCWSTNRRAETRARARAKTAANSKK